MPSLRFPTVAAVLRRPFAAALLCAACASAPPPPHEAPIFFPGPPALPRVQFLASFNGRSDIETQSKFDRFVVGEQPDLRLEKPYGVAMFDGRIYVCDSNVTVVVFDLQANRFGALKGAVGPGKLIQPLNISIEPDGTKYVADPERGQVVVFNRADEYVRAFGVPGQWRPVDAVPFEGRLYVVDTAKRRIQVLDKQTGEPVKAIGDSGEPGDQLVRPTNIVFDAIGTLYVTDAGRFQVVKYDRDGHFKGTVGKLGDNLGHFARPKGAAVDREGHLLVVDAAFNNVQMFNREGRLLMFFGGASEQSAPGSLTLPAKVSLDFDNLKYFRDRVAPGFEPEFLILVTSQFGSRLVNVFAYGHEKGRHYPTEAEIQKEIEARRKRESPVTPEAPPAPTPTPPATGAAPPPPTD